MTPPRLARSTEAKLSLATSFRPHPGSIEQGASLPPRGSLGRTSMTRSLISHLLVSTRRNCTRLCGLMGVLLLAGPLLHAQNDKGYDPPNRVARISVMQGNVSLEPNGVDAFSQAEINYPLTSGDRVYADNNSFAELQTAGLAVRLGNGADVTISSLTDNIAQFGLAQGSIRVRTRSLYAFNGQPGTVEVDTPNGAILVDQ